MSEENFDLSPQIGDPGNAFLLVHVHNRSTVYHMTRQTLLDSIITQDTYCFFYHIVAKSALEFNKMYGSFAYLMWKNTTEANLYLNVDSEALEHIIKYIQTGKINVSDNKSIDEIIDLATMFGMSNLVAMLRMDDKLNKGTLDKILDEFIRQNKQEIMNAIMKKIS